MAYGDSRTSVATDTFDSSISANWENGGGSWNTWSWVSGGHVQPTSNDNDAGLRNSAATLADDQYSIVTVQAHVTGTFGNWFGVAARMQAGTNESAYIGYSRTVDNTYSIYETSNAFGFAELTSSSTGWGALSAGDTFTIEVEGTTIRVGDDRGTDTQRLTTTDATLTGGSGGFVCYTDTAASNVQVTAWEGGDIGAGGATDYPGTGDLDAQAATISGAGLHGRVSTGALSAQATSVSGAGVVGRTGTGTLSAQAADIDGAGVVGRTGTGALVMGVPVLLGSGTVGRAAEGTLAAQAATISGTATVNRVATGALEAGDATISGDGTSSSAPEVPTGRVLNWRRFIK